MKRCSRCKEWKPLEEFTSDRSREDLLCSYCKSCSHQAGKEYRLRYPERVKESKRLDRLAHKEEFRERDRAWRLKNLESTRTKAREYARTHKAESSKRVKKWNRLNLSHKREYARVYRAQNKEHIRIIQHNNRMLRRGTEGTFTEDEWEVLCDRYDNKCLGCGYRGKLEFDHIQAVTRDGTNYISNLQPLCKSCNASKGQKTIDYRWEEVFRKEEGITMMRAMKSPACINWEVSVSNAGSVEEALELLDKARKEMEFRFGSVQVIT